MMNFKKCPRLSATPRHYTHTNPVLLLTCWHDLPYDVHNVGVVARRAMSRVVVEPRSSCSSGISPVIL